jgi:hypothetical protein
MRLLSSLGANIYVPIRHRGNPCPRKPLAGIHPQINQQLSFEKVGCALHTVWLILYSLIIATCQPVISLRRRVVFDRLQS